jgi:hypothetical protein
MKLALILFFGCMYVEHCQLLGGFGEDETATKLIQQYADSVSNWTLYEIVLKCMVKYNIVCERSKERCTNSFFIKKKKRTCKLRNG